MEERKEQLEKSFYANGGEHATSRAIKTFNNIVDSIKSLQFNDCLVQYTEELKKITISLTFGLVDYTIECLEDDERVNCDLFIESEFKGSYCNLLPEEIKIQIEEDLNF